jgi:class 3 adenylate cyclase
VPERLSIEEFASLTQTPVEEVERFRAAGLLDPDGDGLYEDMDVFRLQLLESIGPGFIGPHFTMEQLVEMVHSTNEGRRLFGVDGPLEAVDKVAVDLGLTTEQVRLLGTMLGYDPSRGVGSETREMLATVGDMLAAGLPWEGILEGARVYADTLGRMAEMGIQMTHRYVCEPLEREGLSRREIAIRFGQAGNVAGPSSKNLVMSMYDVYMGRALAKHARAHLDPREEGAAPGSMRATILFVDLALFSSLADVHGDEEAIRVIDRFDQTVRESSLKHDGRLVKQIGDEFMLVFGDAGGAVRFAVELHETMSRIERFVALRTGVHSGSVLYRLGDYYGHAVNVAARIASMAMPNAILVTEPVAKAAADEGIAVEEIGVRSLRGMEEPLALYRVVPSEREA